MGGCLATLLTITAAGHAYWNKANKALQSADLHPGALRLVGQRRAAGTAIGRPYDGFAFTAHDFDIA